MKESVKPKTGEPSVKDESATVPSTPVKDEHVLTIVKKDPYNNNESFYVNLHLCDVVRVEPYAWDHSELDVSYKSICGLVSSIRLENEDEYKIDGKKVSFDQAKLFLDNRMTEVQIDDLPD